MAQFDTITPEQLALLPEAVRKLVQPQLDKGLHTIQTEDWNGVNIQAKVGESKRVISLQAYVNTPNGRKYLQGSRPGIQFRPAFIEAMAPYMGSFGEWLRQYLNDAREAELIDESRPNSDD